MGKAQESYCCSKCNYESKKLHHFYFMEDIDCKGKHYESLCEKCYPVEADSEGY